MATIQRYVNRAASAGGDGTTNGTSGATAAYQDMSTWEANQTPGATDDVVVDCCGSSADTTAVTIDFATSPNSTTIRANSSDSTGLYTGDDGISTAHYRHTRTTGDNILVKEPNVTIDGIQFENTGTGSFNGIIYPDAGNASLTVQNCRFRGTCRAGITGNGSQRAWSGTYNFNNNLFFGGFNNSGINPNPNNFNTATVNILHNTFYMSGSVPAIRGEGAGSGAITVVAKNNACANTTAPFSFAAAYSVTYDKNSTNTGAFGTTNEVNHGTTMANVFTSPGTTQSSQFTVKDSSSGLYNAGATGLGISTDIRGSSRDANPDIGAYELVVAGSDTTVSITKVSLSVSGKTAVANLSVPTAKSDLSISGKTVTNVVSVPLTKSSLAFSGKTVFANTSVPTGKATLTIAGKVALGNVSVPVASVPLTISGKTFTVSAGNSVSIDKATLNWTGKTVFGNISVPLAKVAIAISGKTLNSNVSVAITKVSLTFTGKTVSVLGNIIINISKATLQFVGQTVTASTGVTQYCRAVVRGFTRDFARLFKRDISC